MIIRSHRKTFVLILICIAVLLLVAGGVVAYGASRASKIPALSFQECLDYTLRGSEDAVVSVGIIQGDQSRVTLYGKDAAVIPDDGRSFEIGSLTKTFTAALLQKAIDEGRIQRGESIGAILQQPNLHANPTLEQLLTHRSGYRGYYLAPPMTESFFTGRNSFYGVSRDSILSRLIAIRLPEREYVFSYSNFGFAVLGLALERIYQTDYTSLVNAYVQGMLGMADTHISTGSVEVPTGWDWSASDAYLPAGALISTADDMLLYARHLLGGDPAELKEVVEPLSEIDATSSRYAALGLRMDAIGSAWLLDKQNGIVWHNGGTGHYSCYLGFDPEHEIAVVVLTNLPPDYRIPATILGAKLLRELQTNAG